MRFLILPLLLSAAVTAQVPDKSPVETPAFAKLHDRFLDAVKRINELSKLESPSDAEQRELELEREEVKRLSMAMMQMVLPKQEEERLLPAPERPQSPDEEELRQAAHRIGLATFEGEAFAALRKESRSMRYAETIALDHPALAAITDYRFYLARLVLQPLSGPYERHCYRLVVLDCRRRTLDFRYANGPCKVLESLLEKGGIAAPSRGVARQLPAALEFLWRASLGANVFLKPGASGLTRAQLDKRLGLGRYLGEHPAPDSRVVEGTGERSVVTWYFHADDFGLPLQLRIRVWRFEKHAGKWLGAKTQGAGEFPPETDLADPGVVAAIDAFVNELAKL